MDNRVVITGIGIISGFGVGRKAFWDGLMAGQSAMNIVNKWSMPDIGPRVIARVPSFSRKDYLPKLRPPHPARYCQMAMIATGLAIQDAQIDLTAIDSTRIGTLLSTDFGPNETVEKYLVDLFTKGPQAVRPLQFVRTVANVALGDIARYFRLRGASSMLLGENSVCYAYDLLQDKKVDVVVCGGVDELRDLIVWSYNKLGLLSSPMNETNAASQPYLGQATGMALGEAAAMIVLERLDHAIQRNVRVYAEMLGYATICDRSTNYILCDRTLDDLFHTMIAVLHDAGLSPAETGFVMGCASSHPKLCSTELQALEKIWVNSDVKVTSVKGAVGETFGSAAVLGLGAAALALSNSIIPSCGMSPVPSNEHVKVVTRSFSPTQSRFCLCNSIHIGGNNTSIALSSYSGEVSNNE